MITVIYLSFSELFWRKLFVGNKAKGHFCNSQNTKSLTNGLSGIYKGVIQIVRHSQNDIFDSSFHVKFCVHSRLHIHAY